jgi:hypothetical protein
MMQGMDHRERKVVEEFEACYSLPVEGQRVQEYQERLVKRSIWAARQLSDGIDIRSSGRGYP